jgi:hypothetical protein
MKILYIAPERDAAALAARALQGMASGVTVTWAQTPGSALQWLQANRDGAAVLMAVQAQPCGPFVEQLRGSGLTMPIVVVAGSGALEPAVSALNAGVDGYVVAGPSLEADLPQIVTVALDRERRRREPLARVTAELDAERTRAEQAIAQAERAREQAERLHASDVAASAAKLAEIEAKHTASLAREARICTALQQRLFELEGALTDAEERTTSAAAAFADQLASRHAEFTASLTQTAHSRDVLAAQLSHATAALDEVQVARRADAEAAAEHLRRREADFGIALAEAAAARAAVEAALEEARAANREAGQRAQMEREAAADRHAALEDAIGRETDRRADLEEKLGAFEAAQEEADRRHVEELTQAAERLAEMQSRYNAIVEEHAADRAADAERREALEGRLGALQQQHDDARQQHATTRASLERQLTDAVAAQELAGRTAAAALADASMREAALADRLARESDVRVALERDLADARTDASRGRHRLLHLLTVHRRRGREQTARFEAQLASHRAEADRDRRVSAAEIEQLRGEHEALRRLHATTRDEMERLQIAAADERRVLEHARLASESELQRVSAAHDQLRRSFDSLQHAFQTLERIAGDHAAERARLEAVVADRDAEASAQAERHRASEQAAQDAFARLQQTLQQTRETGAAEIARLQREIDALRRDLDGARADADVLRRDAERVPDLRAQLDASQKERRREFERAPYGLCRCTDSGVITDANHSFVAMLGRRRVDDLRNIDFASAVFDCAGDLRWLLERARTVRKTEAVEAVWRTKDGRNLTVRLQAIATATGQVEIAVEDITELRAVEERLRHAQRMEAVGRLASEVAVTCDALLRDVTREVHDWLTAIGGDDALRRQGERLLTDVTRAASFLKQLGVYGQQQQRSLERVSVQRVLRDLAPVLKRVVGDRIDLVLSKSGGSFDVDVDVERLERVLVNVAAYARQRMPRGGQMRIDLATTAVGRRFVARYPNVRPGDHVLITVTELPGADVHDVPEPAPATSGTPGVDLGTLVDLVGTCGGHLWMEAQPAGTQMLKIHLPKAPAAETSDARGGEPRSDRRHRLTRWFRPTSSAGGVR